ncbi:energy transducer TonB [Luteimonas sp. 8-5]|uniref:energy transducer TonB n=1 Tax=Luteimonas sp. 8-5 TaxID=3039387 RepID=UPI0024373337|nr:energy transducer TonB [Luteimonas sp. 8-5]MDG6347284.1 energy transducer TonB [Luteimonas sp. 8-5]
MYFATAFTARPALIRVAALVVVTLAFAGCKKEQGADAPEAAAGAAPTTEQAAPQAAAAEKVGAMNVDQLREAAGQALRQQRLYAPEGDNAMEYYLALREKEPSDPAVSSALTDLMPYILIATEQSIGREDIVEAKRLYALMEKTDDKAPALPRLKTAIANAETAVAKRAEEEKADAAAAALRQAELEKQRIADQQAQQKAAAEAFAQQQEAERRAAAARQAAAQQAAAQRPAPATTQPAAPAPVTPPPAPRVTTQLRPISTPGPDYPREAQRRRRAGSVEVEFTVDVDGTVSNARVVNADPPRVFDREALQAVNRWRFQPVSSPVTTRRTFQFRPTD